MRTFLKLNIIMILLAFFTVSCNPVEQKGDADSNAKFYDVVYQATASRENKNYSWKPVSGIMQVKISQTSDTEGTFVFFYSNYHEPQFDTLNEHICSGGFKGNILLVKPDATTTTDTGVYDPNNTYTTTAADNTVDLTDPTDPSKTIAQIINYTFDLTVNFRSLDAPCHPESDRRILVYRFANGEIVMFNEYRQLRMAPVLTTLN